MPGDTDAEHPAQITKPPVVHRVKAYLNARAHFLPLAALGVVLLVDAFLYVFSVRLVVLGVLDQTAHLATALIVFFLVAPYTSGYFKLGVIAGTVLIDLDHIPALWDSALFTTQDGRHVSHSILTIAIMLGLVWILKGSAQRAMLGVALGIMVHFFRDLATGGIPLWWPIDSQTVEISYVVYMTTLGFLAAIGFRWALMREQFNRQWNRPDTARTSRWRSIRRFTLRR